MDRFTVISDPTRRKILEIVAAQGRASARDISEQFSISAPAISQHLKILRENGMLRMEKLAQKRIYQIETRVMTEMDEMWEWMNNMRKFWNSKLDTLEQVILKDKLEQNNGKKI